MWNRVGVCSSPLGFPVEHNYRCNGIGIQVNNYFNEMFEDMAQSRGGQRKRGEGACRGRRQISEEVRESRKLAG